MLNRRTFLTYSLLSLTSCTVAKQTSLPSSGAIERPEKLRFAVTDLSGLEALEQDFGAFRGTLSDILELPIEFFPVDNYSAAAPAMLTNELDFVMAGPSEYLLLRARAKAVPLVGVTRPNYYTLITTRVDDGMQSLAELKGKTVAMRTEGSTAGHVVPMKMLLDAGLTPEDYSIEMLGNAGIDALRAGQVDAWAASFRYYQELVREPGLEGTEVEAIATSDPLPPDLFLVNPSLGEPFIEKLRSQILDNAPSLMTALSAPDANAKFRQSEMVAVADSDYQALRDSYHAIGQGSAIE